MDSAPVSEYPEGPAYPVTFFRRNDSRAAVAHQYNIDELLARNFQRWSVAGLFITFEGGEGAGKTTQTRLLSERLAELKMPSLLVREPGGTDLGEYLRDYLKSERTLSREAELLLFEAARVELVTSQVLPALETGNTVIADRFYGSTVAYQGYGRGLDREVINSLNGFAAMGLSPDLTILLDLPPEVGLKRTTSYQISFMEDATGGLAPLERTREGTRFEDLDLQFHRRAREGFLAQAEADRERWHIVDAMQAVDVVSGGVWRAVEKLLGIAPASGKERTRRAAPQGELWPQEA